MPKETKLLKSILPIFFLALILVSNRPLSYGQSEKDLDWVGKHYDKILVDLMPINKVFHVPHIGFRGHQDFRTYKLEYSFNIDVDRKADNIFVSIVEPESKSIYDQLLDLHIKYPKWPIAKIKEKIKIKRLELNSNNCPNIGKAYENFKKLSISIPDTEKRMIIHPYIYKFNIDTLNGDFDILLIDPENALCEWAGETKELLEGCINKSGS